MDDGKQTAFEGKVSNHNGINENGGVPQSSDDLAVAQRAYQLWEEEGHPEGAHDEHWHRAKRQLTDEQLSAGDPSPAGP